MATFAENVCQAKIKLEQQDVFLSPGCTSHLSVLVGPVEVVGCWMLGAQPNCVACGKPFTPEQYETHFGGKARRYSS